MAETVVVSTKQELYDTLKVAKGGETILLRPGDYGEVKLNTDYHNDFDFPSNVTIKSLDSDNPAVFKMLHVHGSNNMTLDGIKFDYVFETDDPVWEAKFLIVRSTNITIKNSTFDGDLAHGLDDSSNGYGYGIALSVRDSENVNVLNNEVYEFYRGLTAGQSKNVVIKGNEIHSLRSDGLNFSGVENTLVEDNHLHNFVKAPGSPDHMDMIQVWTAGTTSPTVGLTIRNNTLDVGGGSETQSIFMRNEVVDMGLAGYEMYYRDIVIENNTIYNGHLHGITVGETDGLTIRNNSVLRADGVNSLGSDPIYVPMINVNAVSKNVTVVNNVTGGSNIAGYTNQSDWVVSKNHFIQDSDARNPGHYDEVFLMSSTSLKDGHHSFMLTPDGPAGGAGSESIQFDPTPDGLTPFFDVFSAAGKTNTLVFDASMTRGPSGLVGQDEAEFTWTFGNGATGQGPIVQAAFDTPGYFDVELRVNPHSGAASTTHFVVGISGDTLVRFDPGSGTFINPQYGQMTTADFDFTNKSASPGAIHMNNSGLQASVSSDDIEGFFGADDFRIDLSLQSNAGSSAAGEVFSVHGNVLATMTASGELTVAVDSTQGSIARGTTHGASLLDGREHDISLRYSDTSDALDIWVDGALNASVAVAGDLPYYPRDLTFGSPWGKQTFTGKITSFEMEASQPAFRVYSADTDGVGGASPADPKPEVLPIIDDFVMDFEGLAGESISMHGDAMITTTGDGTVMQLGAGGGMARLGSLRDVTDSGEISLAMEFRRSYVDDAEDYLIFSKNKLALSVVDDGLRVRVGTKDEGFKSFNIDDLGLDDKGRYQAVVIADEASDRLQVLVDGNLVLDERSTDIDLTPSRAYNWTVGNRGSRKFEGDIIDLRIEGAAEFVDELGLCGPGMPLNSGSGNDFIS